MQIDHLDSKPQCKHQGCGCSVPSGEEFCSEHCRSATTNARVEDRGSCTCGHAECQVGEPPPAR